MSDPKKQVEGFIRESLYDDHPEDLGKCCRFVLWHVTVRGKLGNELHTIPVDYRRMNETAVADLSIKVMSKATDDAEATGGLQRYCLQAYFSGRLDKPYGRCTFRVLGGDEEDSEIDSNPATPDGLLGQLMRHNEALMRSTMGALGGMLSTQQRTIETLQSQNESMLTERTEAFQVVQDLLDRKQERDNTRTMAIAKIDERKAMFDKLAILAPMAVNRITGKEVFPEKVTPEMLTVREVLSSLTDSQLQALTTVLRPEQVTPLIQIAMAEAERKEKADSGKNGEGASSDTALAIAARNGAS